MFYINEKKHELPVYLKDMTIKPTNEMKILHYPENKAMNFLLYYFGITDEIKL